MANLENEVTVKSESIFKHIYNEFNKSLSQELSDSFAELKTDEERIHLIHKIFPSVENEIGVAVEEKDISLALALKERGNNEFVRGGFLKSLLLYSEAVVKVPQTPNLQELSLIVANRSAALYHLEKYREAINDIDYVLKRGYPVELRYKVLERKSKCFLSLKRHKNALESFKKTLQALDTSKLSTERKLKMQKDIQIMLILLSKEKEKDNETELVLEKTDKRMKENKTFPALSGSVRIEKCGERGRFALATKSIEVGETVLVEESFCSVLVVEHIFNHCLACLKRTIAPYPCGQCASAVFCSDKCHEDASKYHRFECGIIGALYKCGMSVLVLMALRMITQRSLNFFWDIKPTLDQVPPENGKKYRSDDYLVAYHLVRHENLRPASNYLERAAIAITLVRCLKRTGFFNSNETATGSQLDDDQALIASLILRHLQILQFNAHEIAEFEVEGTESLGQSQSKFIAGGLYPTLALFNHSCDPGIVRYNLGSSIVVKTVRPLAVGEEVSENYGPIFTVQQRSERREQLRNQYWFDCNCQPCLEDWPMLTEMDKSLIPFRCSGGVKCTGILTVPYSTQEFMINCKKCGLHTNLFKGLKSLQETDSMFRQALDLMNRGKIAAALDIYLNILTLLHQFLRPPFGDYHLCQQAIRKCMLSMGNKYVKLI